MIVNEHLDKIFVEGIVSSTPANIRILEQACVDAYGTSNKTGKRLAGRRLGVKQIRFTPLAEVGIFFIASEIRQTSPWIPVNLCPSGGPGIAELTLKDQSANCGNAVGSATVLGRVSLSSDAFRCALG